MGLCSSVVTRHILEHLIGTTPLLPLPQWMLFSISDKDAGDSQPFPALIATFKDSCLLKTSTNHNNLRYSFQQCCMGTPKSHWAWMQWNLFTVKTHPYWLNAPLVVFYVEIKSHFPNATSFSNTYFLKWVSGVAGNIFLPQLNLLWCW